MVVDPAPCEEVNLEGSSRFVLTCEHASNFIPECYNRLGLSDADLQRHIAWDIGAAQIARVLSARLNAPLFLSGYSRLLIDCNRPPGSSTSIPELSENTIIKGNHSVSEDERKKREDSFFWPIHMAIERFLDRRKNADSATAIVGIHSFTSVFMGNSRPWHAGVLFRKSVAFGQSLVDALAECGGNIAANEPYKIDDDGDYTVPIHGELRGLPAVLIEVRQDLIGDAAGIQTWSSALARALEAIDSKLS